MRQLIFAVAGLALLLGFMVPWHSGVSAQTAPSPNPTYCAPIWTPAPRVQVSASPWANELQHSEVCGGQLGDFFNDGQISTPAPVWTGNAFSWSVTQNVYSVFGQRVFAPSLNINASANATTYCYLDASGWPSGLWSCNQSTTPPNSTSELEYTIVAGAGGIMSVATPAPLSEFLNGPITAADIIALRQAGHAGCPAIYDAAGRITASPCPSIPPLPVSVTNGGTGVSSPSPTATATACGAAVSMSGAFPSQQINVPVCATPTPMATPCPLAGTNITVTGAWPSCTVNSTGGAVNSLVAGQNITLNPSGGTGNVIVAETVTPGPQATPSPSSVGCGTWTGSWPYTNNTTGCASLETANAFTQAQSIEYNAAGTDCNPIVPTEFCVTGTSLAGAVIGAQSGIWTTETGTSYDSQHLYFCRQVSGSAPTCPVSIYLTAGGTIQITGGTVSTNGQNLTTTTGTFTTAELLQNAASSFGGSCSMSSGTVCSPQPTTAKSFTTGICWSQDRTGFIMSHATVSGTAVTVTAASSNSDTFNWFCIGNPS